MVYGKMDVVSQGSKFMFRIYKQNECGFPGSSRPIHLNLSGDETRRMTRFHMDGLFNERLIQQSERERDSFL